MTVVTDALLKLSRREDLTFDEARDVMDLIMSGECSPTLISSYLTALTVKGETVDEIAASAAEMRAHGLRLPGDHSDALEIVGPVILSAPYGRSSHREGHLHDAVGSGGEQLVGRHHIVEREPVCDEHGRVDRAR